jgi:hypothetical protein
MALVGALGLMAEGTYPKFEGNSALLMLLYSTGVLVIFAVFLLLYWHAWRQRKGMELSAVEEVQLKYRARSHGISAGIAVVSLLMLAVAPNLAMFAGMIYALMGPLHAWNGFRGGAAQAKLRSSMPVSPPISSGTS